VLVLADPMKAFTSLAPESQSTEARRCSGLNYGETDDASRHFVSSMGLQGIARRPKPRGLKPAWEPVTKL